MTVTASQVFLFLEQHATHTIERHEIHLSVFSVLRQSIRKLVVSLSEDADHESQEITDTLRKLLSEGLTVPVSFDEALLQPIAVVGAPDAVETRWGGEIRRAYDDACAAALLLQDVENPVRTEVRDVVRQLSQLALSWKIYCHRRARPQFESILLDSPVAPDAFLHSVTDYRDTPPFDVLIKVGPLRSKGWGSAPDALLSAPRFSKLIQIVWSGCDDEDDFGYDPGLMTAGSAVGEGATEGQGVRRAVDWKRNVITVGDAADVAEAAADDDELKVFYALGRTADLRRATLLEIDEADGILYPPHSQVPTFDPAPCADDAIGYRLPGETLAEGMFLLRPLLGAADLGALRAGEGRYSRIWKDRLREEMRRQPDDLVRRLRGAGVELRSLRSCVRHWCRPPSTVIHAPQQRGHFEMLVHVLGIDHDAALTAHTVRRPWWEYAWSEICQARGEAIQTGLQEHEIVDEQLFAILNGLLPEIQRRAATEAIFDLEIPDGHGLTGAVRLYRVRSIDDGFLVPETMLKVVCDLDTADQWRI